MHSSFSPPTKIRFGVGSRSIHALSVFAGFLVHSLAPGSVVNITQYHNHGSRDGLYVDPAFTRTAVTNLSRDLAFSGTIAGNVYAQPLYLDSGPGDMPCLIVATESNNVYALDPATGAVIWQRHLAQPVSSSSLPCGNINPLGITGTPVIDLSSRRIFLDAQTTPDNGTTVKHLIYSLDLETGSTSTNWPIDVSSTATFGPLRFTSSLQNQRSALTLLDDTLYVPYGGNAGDCGSYHGWLLGIPINDPALHEHLGNFRGRGWSLGGWRGSHRWRGFISCHRQYLRRQFLGRR